MVRRGLPCSKGIWQDPHSRHSCSIGVVQEDWGELNTGKRQPAVFVMDCASWEVQPVSGLPEGATTGQPVWTPCGTCVMPRFSSGALSTMPSALCPLNYALCVMPSALCLQRITTFSDGMCACLVPCDIDTTIAHPSESTGWQHRIRSVAGPADISSADVGGVDSNAIHQVWQDDLSISSQAVQCLAVKDYYQQIFAA